jgi:hypothetical protein
VVNATVADLDLPDVTVGAFEASEEVPLCSPLGDVVALRLG